MPTQNIQNRFEQAATGIQEYLTINTSNVAGVVIGSRLLNQVLPIGTYTCRISLFGLSNKLTLYLKATFGGTCTSSGGAVMMDRSTVILGFGGAGAMTSGVRQLLTLSNMSGEQVAILTLVIGGGTATFTEAEVHGA